MSVADNGRGWAGDGGTVLTGKCRHDTARNRWNFWDAARVSAEVAVVPWRRALPVAVVRYAAVGVAAIAVAALHLRHRPASLCVLRSLTGIPCPLCGGTTAAVDLGHGQLRSALGASPFAVGLLALGPLLSTRRPPVWWRDPLRRGLAIGAVLVAAEIWQLVRFGLISF